MALVLDATVGGPSANTYVLVAQAQAYFDARPFSSAWNSAIVADQSAALAYSTRVLDRLEWLGAKGGTPSDAITQALAWPRRWSPTLEFDNPVPQFITEYFIDLSIAYYSSLTIPKPITDATCELALEFLRAGTADPLTRDDTRNVKREKVDVIETEYTDPGLRFRGIGLFPTVVAIIAPLLRSSALSVERA